MELLATFHQWLRAGILSPTKGVLEARAVAAGGGLFDDLALPDALMNIVRCGLTRCFLKPQILMDEVPRQSTVPVHTHCHSALCYGGTPNGLILLCSIGVPYPVAVGLYTVDCTRGFSGRLNCRC